jgi:hypothetical protein
VDRANTPLKRHPGYRDDRIAQARTGSFFIEGVRQAGGFQFGREDVEAACEFMVYLRLVARVPDGSYSGRGEDLSSRALAAMNALPRA